MKPKKLIKKIQDFFDSQGFCLKPEPYEQDLSPLYEKEEGRFTYRCGAYKENGEVGVWLTAYVDGWYDPKYTKNVVGFEDFKQFEQWWMAVMK